MSTSETRWPTSVSDDLVGKTSQEAARSLIETRGARALDYVIGRQGVATDYFRSDEKQWWRDVAGCIRDADEADRARRRELQPA